MNSAVIASTIGSIPRPMMTPTVQAASLSSSGLNRLRMAKPSSQPEQSSPSVTVSYTR